jgi:pyruvate dehydrogenase E2 component (dihydrolipoamide acetyltransferase)
MWNPLGIFGSRVVEAISAAPVESLASAAPVALASVAPVAPAPVAPASDAPAPAAAPMEGQDANSLIATRLGVEPGDVTAKLVALSQQNELDGAANGTVNVSLTLDDLEEFERQEEATAAAKLTLKMRPAVLGATPTRTAPAAVPADPAAAAATPPVVRPAVVRPAAATPPIVREVVHLASPPPPPAAPAPAPAPAPAALWSED